MFEATAISIIFSTGIISVIGDCGIALDGVAEASFTFVEMEEHFPIGGLLAKYPVKSTVLAIVLDPDSDEGRLISISYNQADEHLEFYLKNNLSDYRQRKWLAAAEIKYKLFCDLKSRKTLPKIYTFMLIVKDRNLYTPMFEREVYNFDATFPWLVPFPLNPKPIVVTDLDYNLDHASVEFTCLGAYCEHFSIETELSGHTSQPGYNYRLNMNLLDNSSLNSASGISEGMTLSVTIVAEDRNFSSETLVNFTAVKVGLPGGNRFLFVTIFAIGTYVSTIAILALCVKVMRDEERQNKINIDTRTKEKIQSTGQQRVVIPLISKGRQSNPGSSFTTTGNEYDLGSRDSWSSGIETSSRGSAGSISSSTGPMQLDDETTSRWQCAFSAPGVVDTAFERSNSNFFECPKFGQQIKMDRTEPVAPRGLNIDEQSEHVTRC